MYTEIHVDAFIQATCIRTQARTHTHTHTHKTEQPTDLMINILKGVCVDRSRLIRVLDRASSYSSTPVTTSPLLWSHPGEDTTLDVICFSQIDLDTICLSFCLSVKMRIHLTVAVSMFLSIALSVSNNLLLHISNNIYYIV